MTRGRGRRGGIIAGCLLATIVGTMAGAGPASAGFVSPSAWQQPGATKPSAEILLRRTALTGGIGGAIADSSMLTMEESWALSIFYQARGFELVWMDEGGPGAGALDLVRVLREAASHALDADDYADAVQAIEALDAAAPLEDRIRADVLLSRAALLYARHASAGRIDPRGLSRNNTFAPVAAKPEQVLDALAAAEAPGKVLERYNPQGGDYPALRAAYNRLLKAAKTESRTEVPAGATLKPGMTGDRVALLRRRLAESGDLDSDAAEAPKLFDAALAASVEAFQARKGLPADGVVGPMTLAALNHSTDDQLRKLAVNMERRRWMPDDYGKLHVLVNQPAFKLDVVDDGEVVHSARVVIGKPYHQSPTFSDEIETVVFNPYWGVPDSIAYKEYLPKLRQDPTYLARQGFQMFAASGGRFVPARFDAIDWSHPDAGRARFKFRQPPGRRNALGRVKFLFPNKHSVYLHDTPSRSLFARASRAFSHGCIRVQDPLKFAEVLLNRDGWDRTRIDKAVASGRNQRVTLERHIPVHLTYWTAYADADGEVLFRDDIYKRDGRLADALGFDAAAMKMAQLTDN